MPHFSSHGLADLCGRLSAPRHLEKACQPPRAVHFPPAKPTHVPATRQALARAGQLSNSLGILRLIHGFCPQAPLLVSSALGQPESLKHAPNSSITTVSVWHVLFLPSVIHFMGAAVQHAQLADVMLLALRASGSNIRSALSPYNMRPCPCPGAKEYKRRSRLFSRPGPLANPALILPFGPAPAASAVSRLVNATPGLDVGHLTCILLMNDSRIQPEHLKSVLASMRNTTKPPGRWAYRGPTV